MRKYVLLLLSLFVFTSFFQLYLVEKASAQIQVLDELGLCTTDEAGPPESREVRCAGRGCTVPRICGPNLRCLNSKCIKVDGTSVLQCKCKTPNDRAPGANGFGCVADRNTINFGTYDINRDGAYCKVDEICTDENDMKLGNPDDALDREVYGPDGSERYAGKLLYGVKCVPNTAIAVCRCTPGALGSGTDGQNQMTCALQDKPHTINPDGSITGEVTGTAFCGSTSDSCQNVDPNEHFGDEGLVSHTEGKLFTDFDPEIIGVACRRPEGLCQCLHPGRPGNRINGFVCKQFGRQEIDFCNLADEACVDDKNNVLNDPHNLEVYTDGFFQGIRKNRSQKAVFSGAPLRGVRCDVVPKEPPPRPPCASAPDAEGRCTSFNTAFGEINADAAGFITSLFGLLLAASGGLAVLLIMRAGYLIMTSAGNQERLKGGREQLVAAIVGLLFIIFSFVILQVIGVDILRIPGLQP